MVNFVASVFLSFLATRLACDRSPSAAWKHKTCHEFPQKKNTIAAKVFFFFSLAKISAPLCRNGSLPSVLYSKEGGAKKGEIKPEKRGNLLLPPSFAHSSSFSTHPRLPQLSCPLWGGNHQKHCHTSHIIKETMSVICGMSSTRVRSR